MQPDDITESSLYSDDIISILGFILKYLMYPQSPHQLHLDSVLVGSSTAIQEFARINVEDQQSVALKDVYVQRTCFY